MPSQQANPIHLSPIQHELLQHMVHRTTSEQRLVKRGHIIARSSPGDQQHQDCSTSAGR
jgi:hypothetical protein